MVGSEGNDAHAHRDLNAAAPAGQSVSVKRIIASRSRRGEIPRAPRRSAAASNLGGIGFIAGHQITHGFDLGGSQFDGEGNLRDWWTAEDRQRFLALNDALAAQYSAIEVAPGLFVNGQFTVIENSVDSHSLASRCVTTPAPSHSSH
jgi:hypothetical protein